MLTELAMAAALLQPQAEVIRPDPNIRAHRTATEPRDVWDRVADCETGEWINGGQAFVEGSARWNASEGTFRGGLQFHPGTWNAYARTVLGSEAPSSAHLATRGQQIRVAEAVLQAQGWGAWPACSSKLGLR